MYALSMYAYYKTAMDHSALYTVVKSTIVVRRSHLRNSCAVRLLNCKRRPVRLVWNVAVTQVVYVFRIPVHRKKTVFGTTVL